jgi:hypothetical protein
VGAQLGREVALQLAGVLRRDREHHLVAGVGADRLAQLLGELAEILMGQA